LQGYWPFNGNANDESGNGNNGTVNGAVLTTDRNGNTNAAYSFNGINDFIIANSNPLYVSDTLTISIWINTNISPSIISNYTVFELGGTGGSGVRWGCIAEPGNAVMAIGRGCGGVGNATISTSYNGGWSNFIFVVSGLSQSIYYNGNLVGNSTNSQITSLSCSIANLYFGVSQWDGSFYFTGKLDDIGIWNRALTQQEITDLYNVCQLSVNMQPSSQTININNNTQFVVSSSNPSATYQWQTNGVNLGWQNIPMNSTYSGGASNTLTVNNVQLANHNQPFRVIASSGNCTDTSNIATIQIADTCITNVTVYDTLLTTVTDTLIINTTLSLPAPNNENTILLYPNPASDHITIDNGNFTTMTGYSIKITNNAGQVVFLNEINQQQFYMDLNTWTGNGLYLVHLIDPQNNTVTVRKIVLQ
jgi:hypothetical protein